MNLADLHLRLRLPVVAAPMFLVSGLDLVVAASRAGVIGAFPCANARSLQELESWLVHLDAALRPTDSALGSRDCAPYAVNIIVQREASSRFVDELALISRFRSAIVISSVGPPADVVSRVHAYGGLVFHDVATMRHAEKAIEAGVDGLILLTAGAGGHTGTANPFAFIADVRRHWGGALLLAGAITDGRSILAARVLGADFAYMGTRFAATKESLASSAYKALLVTQAMGDIITTDRVSGLSATFMRGSIARAGLDPENLPPTAGLLKPTLPNDLMAWRDIWSAGHGVGSVEDIPAVADLVDRLEAEFHAASSNITRP